jgi:hypothetical protein
MDLNHFAGTGTGAMTLAPEALYASHKQILQDPELLDFTML